jgi:hypothetical protein
MSPYHYQEINRNIYHIEFQTSLRNVLLPYVCHLRNLTEAC